jgi:hypothetical protein
MLPYDERATYTATIRTFTEPDYDSDPRTNGDCDCEHCQRNTEAWLRDEWHYYGVIVEATVTTEIDGKTFDREEWESLWGVDDIDPDYPATVAAELKDELVSLLTENYPGITIEEE